MIDKEISKRMSVIGAKGGRQTWANMTPEQRSERALKMSKAIRLTPEERSERARKAAKARWLKKS